MPETSKILYMTTEEVQQFKNPPIGTIVHWYPQADLFNPKMVISAGMVTSHEGPGVLSMTVFPKSANPRYLFGVRNALDPFHKRKAEATMKNGGWLMIKDSSKIEDFIEQPDPEPAVIQGAKFESMSSEEAEKIMDVLSENEKEVPFRSNRSYGKRIKTERTST